MNAPLPEHLRHALATVTLDDKYSLKSGRAFMSGVQALVRLPMLIQERDGYIVTEGAESRCWPLPSLAITSWADVMIWSIWRA